MRTRIGAVLGLVGVLSLAAACSREPSPEPEATLTEGARAPDFSLRSADGESLSLSRFRGRPVLLYFSMGPG